MTTGSGPFGLDGRLVFLLLPVFCFSIRSLTNKHSLVDLSVFKDRNFSAGTIIQVVIQAVLYASLVILPQFLQSMMGYTAFLSGATMMPRGFGSMLAMLDDCYSFEQG